MNISMNSRRDKKTKKQKDRNEQMAGKITFPVSRERLTQAIKKKSLRKNIKFLSLSIGRQQVIQNSVTEKSL